MSVTAYLHYSWRVEIVLKPYQTEKQLVRVYKIIPILLAHTITLFFLFFCCCCFLFFFLFAVNLSFIGAKIESFMRFFRENWPHVKITPKLHMLEQHVDFIAKWGAAFGYYGEQGAESLHNEFNKLNQTYCSIKPNTKWLEYILKEHHRQVNPEAKAIQPKTKKRKIE